MNILFVLLFAGCEIPYELNAGEVAQAVCTTRNTEVSARLASNSPALTSLASVDERIEVFACPGGSCARLVSDLTVNIFNPLPAPVSGVLEVLPYQIDLLDDSFE